MSDHDHLDPLPDPTLPNLLRMFFMGLVFGAFALLADAWITQALLGFEYPYIVFAVAFMSIFAITGAFKDNSLPMVLTDLTGIVIGVLATNYLRVAYTDRQSVLAGLGL